MKKKIILSFAVLILFTTAVSPIYAAQNSSLLPPWFIEAIKPIQDSISSLFTKTDNHEARIAELENKVNFDLPNQWGVSFYEDRFILNTPNDSSPGTISLPNIPPDYNCTWNKAVIDLNTTARVIAHLSTGDVFGVGTCREITFKSSVIPASGTSFETDIYLWWQGTEKHAKQTITVPARPFPTWGLTSSIGGSTISGSFTGTGIGTTSPGINLQYNPDCGSFNCNDLLKINN